MSGTQFDAVLRRLREGATTRRIIGHGLGAALIAAGLARWSGEDLDAKKRKRKGKKRKNRVGKPLENEFGCRNVGVACTSAAQCCSGICQGNGGKKAIKTCRAHDTGGCQADQGACLGTRVPCTTTTGESGFCETTTGNAGYCASDAITFDCTRDEDCIPFCGPLAACGPCSIDGGEPFRFCAGPSGCDAP